MWLTSTEAMNHAFGSEYHTTAAVNHRKKNLQLANYWSWQHVCVCVGGGLYPSMIHKIILLLEQMLKSPCFSSDNELLFSKQNETWNENTCPKQLYCVIFINITQVSWDKLHQSLGFTCVYFEVIVWWQCVRLVVIVTAELVKPLRHSLQLLLH